MVAVGFVVALLGWRLLTNMTQKQWGVVYAWVINLTPLIFLLSPPWYMWWPPNWKRYKVGGTRMDDIDGYRITFLPATKGMRPFLPKNIRITKSWFSWNIEIYGIPYDGDRMNAVHLRKDRHPGESWPHPLTIMRWMCEENLRSMDLNPDSPLYYTSLSWLKCVFGQDLVTLETINEYVPNYVHVPKFVFKLNDDY